MIVVTGGAGCIGSAVVWGLNKRGVTDVILVDGVDHPEKAKNIESLDYHVLENKDIFLNYIINSNVPWSVMQLFIWGDALQLLKRMSFF